MPLTLQVDAQAWRAHQRSVFDAVPGIVPVAKGNGYGFTNDLLAHEAATLGADVIAVGLVLEANDLRAHGWEGEIVVLNPWRPGDVFTDPGVVATISRVEDLARIADIVPGHPVLIEVATSMRRHGIPVDELHRVEAHGLDVRGWTIHLPAAGDVAEARRLAEAVAAHPLGEKGAWFSHLSPDDYRELAATLPIPARMRVGTRLWLGAPSAFRATATVLDVHRVSRGDTAGYHGARIRRDGCIVVVAAGTAHGVALAAPATPRSFRQKMIPIAEALQEVGGNVTSPFTIAGAKPPFVEPPHMHSSLVFVEGPGLPVHVGDEVPVTVRMTTTHFDEVVLD